jgi:hypothetical protein
MYMTGCMTMYRESGFEATASLADLADSPETETRPHTPWTTARFAVFSRRLYQSILGSSQLAMREAKSSTKRVEWCDEAKSAISRVSRLWNTPPQRGNATRTGEPRILDGAA